MIKQITFIIIATIFICRVTAQESFNPEWRNSGDIQFGFAIGSTSSALSLANDNTTPNSSEFAIAYTVGARIDYFLNRNWSVKVMPSYDVRAVDNFFWDTTYKYLTIPVLANWHFGKNRRWNLHFGPHYSAALDTDTLGSSFGFDIGIGIIIPISSFRFFIEFDSIIDVDNGELFATDNGGNSIGTGNLQWQRSAINFGFIF